MISFYLETQALKTTCKREIIRVQEMYDVCNGKDHEKDFYFGTG